MDLRIIGREKLLDLWMYSYWDMWIERCHSIMTSYDNSLLLGTEFDLV